MALLALVLLVPPGVACWHALADRYRLDWREALVGAAIIWSLFAFATAALLSIGVGHDLFAPAKGHLSRWTLVAVWALPAIAGIVYLVTRRSSAAVITQAVRDYFAQLERFPRWMLGLTVACALVTLIVAVVGAPNNWDSMTYHLSRVAAWLQLGGVAHYATNSEPQLYQPPGAEVLIVHWHGIVGSDRFDAVLQWVAYAGSIAAASLAAARLGASARGQVFAAFLVASTPMAMLQASSTQNDLITGFWLLAAATLVFGCFDEDRRPEWRLVAAAAAIGIALATKGTAIIFSPPILVAGLVVGLRRCRSPRGLLIGLACALLLIAPSAPQMIRDHATFGSFISAGSADGENLYRVGSIGPSATISNAVRNTAIHLSTPSAAVNDKIAGASRKVLSVFSIDANDPATTLPGFAFEVGKFGPDENHAGNLALLALIFWTLGALLFVKAFRTRRRLGWAAIFLAQALLLCITLKWQPWNVRLHLPIFILAAPLVGVYLGQVRKAIWPQVALVLIALTLPLYLFYNYTRPLVGQYSIVTTSRASQYFRPRLNIQGEYRAGLAAAEQGSPKSIGLALGNDAWSYPFWALRTDKKTPVGEVLVIGPASKYAVPRKLPEVVLCVNCDARQVPLLTAAGFTQQKFVSPPPGHDPHLDERPSEVTLWRRQR